MKVAYPTIFTDVENNILIEVPDLGILTESNAANAPKASMAEAITMARDAIGTKCIYLQDCGEVLAEASNLSAINIEKGMFYQDGIGIVSLVDVDLDVYRRKSDNKMVRRNVTLPNWLNIAADTANINVSKVLQEALMSKLGIFR